MANYQIRNLATDSILFDLCNVEFATALKYAKNAAYNLDGDIAIFGEPMDDASGITQELWRSEP